MKNNKIIIAETEKIFLEFCKELKISNIKTNDDIIVAEKNQEDEINLVIVHWKNIIKTVEFIKNKYIVIEDILLCNKVDILSNWELKTWDVIIPNTFISKSWETKFLNNTIWKDYDLNSFWLILSWICSENIWKEEEFEADVKSENIFIYLKALESEELLEKVTVISQIWDEFKNIIAITDMKI